MRLAPEIEQEIICDMQDYGITKKMTALLFFEVLDSGTLCDV